MCIHLIFKTAVKLIIDMKVLITFFILQIISGLTVPDKKQQGDKRKLGLLDWFDSDEEKSSEAKSTSEASTQKIMELIKMADSFKNDPHFKVSLNISYKNLDPSELQALQSKNNSERKLTLKPNKLM